MSEAWPNFYHIPLTETKKTRIIITIHVLRFVIRVGLEPTTPSLKGMCSTC